MMKNVDKKFLRIGLIGLGCRGQSLLKTSLLTQKDAVVTAVCDVYEDRIESMRQKLKENGFDAEGYTDYRALIASDKVDVVIIATAWEYHVPIALCAMEAHVAVGMEVGGAYSVDDCWALVRTQERTGTPFMFLENCNYDRRETTLFNMIEAGIFGKVVACDGGYMHDLRTEIAGGERNRHYRLRNYLNRNCENYPTHELGPIERMLGINRGNRMVSLVSIASGSHGVHEYLQKNEPDSPYANAHFAQADIVTTIITCAGGETITLRLDTTLPRYYSRGITVHGTKALYTECNNTIYVDGEHNPYDFKAREIWNNFADYGKPYQNKNWNDKDSGASEAAGHGGMDYFMMTDFLDHVRSGEPMPIDVYDAASMMCIAPLSEESIVHGGAPVYIPDFTRGNYLKRK